MDTTIIKSIATLNALMSSAYQCDGVISIHNDLDIKSAESFLDKGLLYHYPENSTNDPNERCYRLTDAGKQYVRKELSIKMKIE